MMIETTTKGLQILLPIVLGVKTTVKISYRQNYGQDCRLYWLPSGWMVGDARGAP